MIVDTLGNFPGVISGTAICDDDQRSFFRVEMIKTFCHHPDDMVQGFIAVIGWDPYNNVCVTELFNLASGIIPHCRGKPSGAAHKSSLSIISRVISITLVPVGPVSSKPPTA